MHDDSPNALLDDVRKHTQRRGNTLVASAPAGGGIDIDIDVRAGFPFDVRCMDGILDIGSVEVDEFLGRLGEPENAPCISRSTMSKTADQSRRTKGWKGV